MVSQGLAKGSVVGGRFDSGMVTATTTALAGHNPSSPSTGTAP